MANVNSEFSIGWVKAPTPITGLDHLGSAAPCVAIYATLLPGVTNVTDRARYYSFYAWFLWKYEQTSEPVEASRFHELYRRADCLFTMIAEWHGKGAEGDRDHHGSRMVGRDKLVPALNGLGGKKSIRLSTFTTHDENGQRYFKNRLGGLGQYYLATLEELGILTGRKGQFVQYDPARGVDIAKRFDLGVPSDLFWTTIIGDVVNAEVLDALSPFCPCQLERNEAEHNWLSDLFFGRLSGDEPSAERRKQSLALLLHLTQEIESDPEAKIDPMTFRDACYSGSLPAGGAWNVPPSLVAIRGEWQLYQRNELLSVACQAGLTLFVRALEIMEQTPSNARDVAEYLLSSLALQSDVGKPWVTFVDEQRHALPPLMKFQAVDHELYLTQRLFELDIRSGQLQELGQAVAIGVRILAALTIRGRSFASRAYGDLPISDTTLNEYPINLHRFEAASAHWQVLTVGQVIEWLLNEWVCEAHLQIAMRKLRFTRVDTFRFYPTEQGLKPREVPPYGYSNPRVRQAIQILRDLSCFYSDETSRLQLTADGRKRLEILCQT